MILRDYLYLDTQRLTDYLAALEPGEIQDLDVESTRADSPAVAGFGESEPSATKRTERQRISVGDRHSFQRLYDRLGDSISKLDADSDVSPLRRGQIVEVFSEFDQSPVTRMIDSFFEIAQMMQQFNPGEMDNRETQEVLAIMTTLFAGQQDAEDKGLPMISEEAGTAFLFVAQSQYLLRTPEEFQGEMSILGKISRVLPPGSQVDLLDLLKLFPRSLRRKGEATAQLRQGLTQLFTGWPDELGGPLDEDALQLEGPAVIVEPLAAFN